MTKKIRLTLTEAQARAILVAFSETLWSASEEEAISLFGSASKVRAAWYARRIVMTALYMEAGR